MATWASTYETSATYGGYTGHSASSGDGLRDNTRTGGTSVWGSSDGSNGWIKIDLGSAGTVTQIQVCSIDSSFDAWGPAYANDAVFQGSANNTDWTAIVTLSGHSDGTPVTYSGLSANYRYFRIVHPSNYLGIGDWFITYTIAAANAVPVFMNQYRQRRA